MNKYKIIVKDHSDTVIEADYILLVQDTTCFFRISNKGVNTVSFIVGTAPKESVVAQI